MQDELNPMGFASILEAIDDKKTVNTFSSSDQAFSIFICFPVVDRD